MPGKRKRLSNASPMPAYYTNTGGYNLPVVEIRGRAPQWAKNQNYYDQLANFYADRFDVNGNNSRLPEIIGRAKANPEFWNEDGSLNQKGNAYITQQKHFGVGSNYYNRMNEYAKQTAYGLAQVAGAPYLAGLTGRQLLGSTIGGTIGSMEGYEIGKQFDNPATGNYAGSELGSLLGGLAGGAIGFKPKPIYRNYIKGMTKLDQAQTRYWDRKELNQLLKNPQITSENNIGYEVKPTIRTKVGDVEIDNPGLYYHQSDAGKAKNFVSTGRMRTPLEEYWLAKEEAGERIPIKIRSGIEPGYPQSPGSAMFAKGNLWYGLDPNKPDLLVTAKEMPISNKNASIMSNKSSLKNLEAQGPRRVTNDNIYIQGPHNRQNTAAYIWEPDYGYKRVYAEESPIVEWPVGSRAQRPFGGGIPDGVPFVENPINYNSEYIGWSPNNVVNNRPFRLNRAVAQADIPISQTVRNRQYVPVDEDVINSWRINRNRMAFNDINNNRIRPYSGARRANSKNNYKYSRNEQSWLNPKNPKVAEQYNRNIRAAKYLKGAGASLPFVALALNQTPDMLYYNDEGYQIDPETNQILDTPVNRRLYTQREHQRRVNKAANPKLEQAANRFINLNSNNTTNKSSNKNTATNNQSNNTPIQQYNWGQGRKPFYDSSNKLTFNSFAKPLNSTSQTKNKTTNKQSTSTNTTHTVKSGDSPWQIAKDNGISLNTFYKLNPNARNGIYPGDVVNVNKSANIHKVKSGDSPWQIAKDNNISLDELYRLNPEARNMIYPGDELILPDKTRNKKRYGGSLRRRLESGGYLSY